MKIQIALSGFGSPESNLETLQRPVPSGNYTYFGMNPITHSPNMRRLNEQLNPPPKAKELNADEEASTIKRRKKKNTVLQSEDDGGLGEAPADPSAPLPLPNGMDMYYGLKPIEHNPVTQINREMDGIGCKAVCSSPIKLKVK